MNTVDETALPPRPRESAVRTVFSFTRDFVWQPVRYHERFGDVFRVRFLGDEVYVVRDPELLKDVLISRHADYQKDKTTRILERLLGRGLLTSSGELWRNQRRLMQPAFVPARVDGYAGEFVRVIEAELATWGDSARLEMHAAMSRLSLRLALSTLFGVDGTEVPDFEVSMRAVMEYFRGVGGTGVPLPSVFPSPGNIAFRRARRHLRGFVSRLIDARRREGCGSGNDLLSHLVAREEKGGAGDAQLVDEGVTLLLAGHETTALALTYALLLLQRNPSHLADVRAEAAATWDRGVPVGEIGALEKTVRVIKESMRLYPPAWFLGREALEDSRLGPYAVSKGTQVWIFVWAVHRTARLFEDPDAFRPDRWTPSFERSLAKTAYLPFGAGPRVCIGNRFALLEATLALSLSLHRFDVQFDTTDAPPFMPSITLRPKGPMMATVARRKG